MDNLTKALLVVSFGTTYAQSRAASLDAIETRLRIAYPDYTVRRAYTSKMILRTLAERDHLFIPTVAEAMQQLAADGFREVVIQPTHVMGGYEYNDILRDIQPCADQFDQIRIGTPLLSSEQDFDDVVAILSDITRICQDEQTAFILMGHGTEHEANAVYDKMQKKLFSAGINTLFIGTVEAKPELEDVIRQINPAKIKRIILFPLMIVAGDHANNDMAGDEENSWKSILTREGYEVHCVLKGLGEYTTIQEIFVRHAANAIMI